MTTYWCELAWLGGAEPEAGVVVEVEGERIASVESGAPVPPPGSRRLDGLTLPGLANAHSHAFQRALRGRTHSGRGDFWSWREAMYELASRLEPDAYFALARATYGEMALAGITCVGEFHYLHHGAGGALYDDANEMGRILVAAAREAGIRITLLDACYLHGGVGVGPQGAQLRFADRDVDAWAARFGDLAGTDEARVGAAIHSVRAVDPASARVVAEAAAGRPVHAHVSEQRAENEACLDAFGLTPTELLEDVGALSDRFTAIHATHLGERDAELLSPATCCLCPTTERDLGDGIAQASRLRSAGVRLALGSDSHGVIDLFEEARAVELDERLDAEERGRTPAHELLLAATANGHVCLGWPEAGRIAPGGLADLVTVGLDSVRLAGTEDESAIASLVFASSAADVRSVVAGGREMVREGAHVALDVRSELSASIAAVWS